MRPYVTEVESNIQGGVKAKLGPKTLIIGPNRIGKSSIIRAIELALSGRASDVAGRDTLALDADLWTLAPDGADSIEATAQITLTPDVKAGSVIGSTFASWTLTRGKKSKRVGPSAIFPLREVTKAILGNAETARKFFLSVASRVTWDEVLAEIPAQFYDRLKPYARFGPSGSAGVDGLLAAIEGTKKRVREINAEVKAQRSTAQSMSVGLPPPPSAAEVANAKAASEASMRARQTQVARERLTVLDGESEALEGRLRDLVTRGEACKAKLAPYLAQPKLPDVVSNAIAVADYHEAHKLDTCIMCGSPNALRQIVERGQRAKVKIQAALAAEREVRALEAEARNIGAEVSSIEWDVKRLTQERETLLAIVGPASDTSVLAPSSDYAAIVSAAAKWEAVRNAEGEAVRLEAESAIMAQLPTVCSTAMERLLDRARDAFEKRVQSYLPNSMRFGVELRDGDREVFHVGLYRWPDFEKPGILSTALSGAEWAAVTIAIAAAVADLTAKADEPVIVIPEDRDFDSNTLADVMAAFSAFEGQVILAGTKPPAKPVEGWTVIDLGASNDMPWCAKCKAWISAGPCEHNVGKRRVSGDLFGA